MKAGWLLGCCLGLVSGACCSADAGIVTLADGELRLLRGVNWYRLVEGARVLDGDVVETAERAQAQVELLRGGSVNLGGPTALYIGGAAREGRQASDLYLAQGWLKVAAKAPGAPLRLRSLLATIELANAVVVAQAAASAFELFVESGEARVIEPGRSGADALRAVHEGGFARRASGQPFAVAGRAPPAFVAAMPRQFMDTLPSRMEKFKSTRAELKFERAITFAEAEPWLNGPYRSVFIRRLEPRLADTAFRTAASANAQAYPEWSSILAPRDAATTEAAKLPERKESGLPWPFSHR
jgi:hypothetical protein